MSIIFRIFALSNQITPHSPMMTFRDDQKLINISMQTIYFMLSEEQRTQHKEMVEIFNSLKAFTLGLYEFKILTKLGSVNSSLSDDIKAEIEANNLIVRLPNDTDGNFIYVFNNIDLSEDRDIVEEHLHNFVVELAKQSIALLKERQAADIDGSELSSKLDNVIYSFEEGIKASKRSYARHTTPATFKELHRNTYYHSFDEKLKFNDHLDIDLSDNKIGTFSEECDRLYKLNGTTIESELTRVLSCLDKHGIPKSKRQVVASELMDIFAEMFSIPAKEETKAIARSICDNKSDAILIDKYSRMKPAEKPNLKIYIERIPYIDGRGNKNREKYGVRICAGSFEQKILFEETTQTMVYIAALLRHKMGKKLFVHEFRNNMTGTAGARENAKLWLKKIYTTIIKPENSEFDKWIDSISSAKNAGKKLNTAASSSKRVVKESLEMYPDAIYYSLLISERCAANGAYYTFNCSPDDIIVCGELQEALRGAAGVY